MYVLISLAVVFLALAIIAIIFYINYRSLNSRYSLLVEVDTPFSTSMLYFLLSIPSNYLLVNEQEKNKNLEMNEIASNSSTQSAEENVA